MKTILPFNLMSDKQADEIIAWFKANITIEDIKERAEVFFKDAHGGILKEENIIPRMIHKLVVQYAMNVPRGDLGVELLDRVESALVEHYGHENWVPPRILMREALALTIHLAEILAGLAEVMRLDKRGFAALEEITHEFARTDADAEAAFLLTDVEVDVLLGEIFQRGNRVRTEV